MKQTSIELLKQDLDAELKLGTKMVVNWDMYIKMHKQEIIDAFELWRSGSGEQYYQETFVSKDSDEVELPKQEISDEEIEKSMRRYNITDFGQMAAYITGAKWYREQLKQRQ